MLICLKTHKLRIKFLEEFLPVFQLSRYLFGIALPIREYITMKSSENKQKNIRLKIQQPENFISWNNIQFETQLYAKCF